MIYSRKLSGIVPVVVTTLNEDESVDQDSQEKLIKFLNHSGVAGYWCLGTGSEDMNLTFENRLLIAKILCKSNNGKLPLILGAGFYCMQDTLNFIDETSNLDFDAYHIMPYHPKLSMNLLVDYYKKIADFSKKPIWLYTSANWCQSFKPDFVEELMHYKNIAGIKFSSSNTVDQLKVLNMQNEKFQVITAVANQLFAALSMGSKASTSSLASAIPEVLIEIYDDFINGELKESMNKHQTLMKFLNLLPKTIKKDNFLGGAEEKYMLSKRNICKPFMTSYYRCLTKDEKVIIDQAIEKCSYGRFF